MKQQHTTQNKVLIIGCGIAGPALAMFLQEAGFNPIIYERHSQLQDDTGYFLNLSPNGLTVLNTLGLKNETLAQGTLTNRIIFQNHNGKKLGENPEPTILIKRGLLSKVLREAALERGINIKLAKKLTHLKIINQHKVQTQFEDGSSAHGHILIGCDGIYSQTRQSILPDAPQPEYLGVIDSGGFTHNVSTGPADGILRMTFGTDGFFGYQKTPSGEIYWFENFAHKQVPDHNHLQTISNDEWRNKLLNIHKDDHAPIAEIIRSTKGKIGKWPNYEMPSLRTWHKGPVSLIGDAAHAMSPSAGQGASMALEDAIMLAKCLRDIRNLERAFSTFEQLRKTRVEKIAKDARRNSDQKGPTNMITRRIRDIVLPFFLKIGVKSARQYYSYEINWNEKITNDASA